MLAVLMIQFHDDSRVIDAPFASSWIMSTASTNDAAPRAAIYARVSTTNHGQDVGMQLDDLDALSSNEVGT